MFNVVGSKGDIYKVGFDILDGWFCPCPDYQFRKHECKHITECKNHVDCPSDLLFCEVIA
ncbi:MAG: hypothetical protein IJ743_00400 [Bacilli bacterium]|nr:hypothetical protein [Bacilli bacterium]